MKRAIVSALVLCLGLGLFMGDAFSGARSEDPLGIAVSPQTLLLGADQGGTVAVHTEIPYGSVNRASLELNGIPVRSTKADACGDLVAFFSEAAVKEIVSVPSATLTLSGATKTGVPFAGSDTVQVRNWNQG